MCLFTSDANLDITKIAKNTLDEMETMKNASFLFIYFLLGKIKQIQK